VRPNSVNRVASEELILLTPLETLTTAE
jgi:hypothetical protein